MSILDIDNKSIISPISLIDDGWRQSRRNERVFLKWITITFKNGRTLHCEFFYSFASKEIVDTETGTIRFTNKMDLLKEFVDSQLEYIRKKYEK